jgi:hypothetical protein
MFVFIAERTCQEERGIQKADQGEEEQSQEGIWSWSQNCPTQGQEERRLNIMFVMIYWALAGVCLEEFLYLAAF